MTCELVAMWLAKGTLIYTIPYREPWKAPLAGVYAVYENRIIVSPDGSSYATLDTDWEWIRNKTKAEKLKSEGGK